MPCAFAVDRLPWFVHFGLDITDTSFSALVMVLNITDLVIVVQIVNVNMFSLHVRTA